MIVNPNTNNIYVTKNVSKTVSVIDGSTNKLSATVALSDYSEHFSKS
jgi:YVTN family beta-propeller protein